jgi:hypothetical protein
VPQMEGHWTDDPSASFPPLKVGGFTEKTVRDKVYRAPDGTVTWGRTTYSAAEWQAQLAIWQRDFPNIGHSKHETKATASVHTQRDII